MHKVCAFELDFYVKNINDLLQKQEDMLADAEKLFMNNYTIPNSDGYRTVTECMFTHNEVLGMTVNNPNGIVRIGLNCYYMQDKLNPREPTTI